MTFEIVAQILFVNYTGKMMQVTKLSAQQHSGCILVGATVIIVSTILKLTPAHWVEKLPIRVDENKALDANDPLMSAYNKQANAKVTKKGVHPD